MITTAFLLKKLLHSWNCDGTVTTERTAKVSIESINLENDNIKWELLQTTRILLLLFPIACCRLLENDSEIHEYSEANYTTFCQSFNGIMSTFHPMLDYVAFKTYFVCHRLF